MAEVNKVYHANCYLDGTVNLLGKFSELKLPDIAPVMAEHKGVGMVGTIELPSGLGPLVLTAKWNGFYPEIWKAAADPFKAHRFQIRGNVETYDAAGRSAEQALVVLATGRWKKAGGAMFKAQESSEFDDEMACTYLKAELGGVELYEIDVINNVWKVDGVDLLETMRKNIGA